MLLLLLLLDVSHPGAHNPAPRPYPYRQVCSPAPPCHTSCIRSCISTPMPHLLHQVPCPHAPMPHLLHQVLACLARVLQPAHVTEAKHRGGGGRGASVLSACQLAGQHVKQIALSAVMRSRECTRRAPPHPTHHSVCLLVNAPHHHGVLLPTPPTILSACSC